MFENNFSPLLLKSIHDTPDRTTTTWRSFGNATDHHAHSPEWSTGTSTTLNKNHREDCQLGAIEPLLSN